VISRQGAALSLRGVTFSYGSTVVIRNLSLDVEPGEMIALLGASGCGKTTLLKLIAGLLPSGPGTIAFDGEAMNGVPVEMRRTGMVFQKPLLFPYLSVEENVGFSLKMRGISRLEMSARVLEALATVRLEGYGSRRPGQLSGGQEQRVALARALVSDPRILLLDEPFASLDENLRAEIRTLVRGIQRKLGITAVFVTHDRREAAVMADRIAFLHEGRIEQCGALRDFYERPATIDVARFFGWQILRGNVTGGTLQTVLGSMPLPRVPPQQGPVWMAFRPEAASLTASNPDGALPTAIVESSVDLGSRIRTVALFPSGETVQAEHPAPEFELGRAVAVSVLPEAVRLFPSG
jgi:putative spermidine/putrescine transport system ATP-binding protein